MSAIEFIRPFYISTAYYFTLWLLCWSTVLYYVGSGEQKILRSQGSPMQMAAVVLTLMAIFFLGLRPVTEDFGDMWLYARTYEGIDANYVFINDSEWLWTDIIVLCRNMGMNTNEYFFTIEMCYIGCMFICSMLIMRKNLWISMLFFFISFSSYSYGTNGIRNGLAASIVLVALSLLPERGFKGFIALILMFLAMGIHRSTFIPSAAAISSLFVIRDTKMAIRFWLVSIALSLVVGPYVERLFVLLSFDDRMENYYMGQFKEGFSNQFSHTGFRWDFLLYSAFPVAMIWYTTRYRLFTHKMYTMFANSYLISNAFWILIIRSSFSNRFAYLSWFLYPVVIAFPLLRMNLWKDQDRRTAIVLFLFSGFTLYMYFIYYFGTTGFHGFDQYWWID